MEEPIKLGIRLRGKDLEKFKENLNNPKCPPEGIELIKKAQEHARKMSI